MRKRLLPILVFMLITVSCNTRVNAQASTSAMATATANVITPIVAVKGSILNFGKFSPQETGGEVVISPEGTRSASGSVVLGAGIYNQAIFYITGQPEYNVAVSLPTMPTMLTNLINGKTMQVHKWTSLPSMEAEITLPTSGALNLNMGATLKVGDIAENPVGIYSGTYIITFSYN